MRIFGLLATGAIALTWILGMIFGKRFMAQKWWVRTVVALGIATVIAGLIVLGHVLG